MIARMYLSWEGVGIGWECLLGSWSTHANRMARVWSLGGHVNSVWCRATRGEIILPLNCWLILLGKCFASKMMALCLCVCVCVCVHTSKQRVEHLTCLDGRSWMAGIRGREGCESEACRSGKKGKRFLTHPKYTPHVCKVLRTVLMRLLLGYPPWPP
jgi:hypothetical protein